ncbi:EAL domain-containing protein [Deinococcus sp.]|uniref:EAL domain-containing protein n=1 Tax=Deinococcus sp. TaxID=47478 RepID=UPI002869A3E3|nr:EAL domain-containing protein [Deinococcus sp.]
MTATSHEPLAFPPPNACGQCQVPTGTLPELTMAFQPIVNVQTRKVFAYEALVRGAQGQGADWVFEQITPAQRYAFDQACRTVAIHTAARLNIPCRLSINIMPGAVYEPRTCIQATLRAARETGFPLERLMFEITEHEDVPNPQHVRHIIDTYRAYGFTTALDDYGTGYATAGLLMALQPDMVKIDRSLVQDVHRDAGKALRIRDMVQFAERTNMLVIAEGIERVEEARTLARLGITLMQGYYVARPGFETLPAVAAEVFDAFHGIPLSPAHYIQTVAGLADSDALRHAR